MEPPAWLEGNAERRGAQPGGQAGTSVLLQGDVSLLDGPPVARSKAKVSFHCHDPGSNFCHGAGATKYVHVVAWRLLDDLKAVLVLTDQLSDEGERASV